MSVAEIRSSIQSLSRQEVVELKRWFDDYHFQLWDAQIEDDLESGRLDSLIAEAEAEYDAGLAKPL